MSSWPSSLNARLAPSDVVQETFLEAIQKIGQFTGTSEQQLGAWLSQALQNNLRDSGRREIKCKKRTVLREVSASRSIQDGDALEGISASGDPTGEDQLILDEGIQRMWACLGELTPADRELLLLYAEGRPYREIARLRQISVPGVSKAVARAIVRLRERLTKDSSSKFVELG
jgi:RNA polymerase sigma-70 factor (ECF subfamily)